MTHSDDNGLVLPPRIAPEQIIIMPIYRNEEDRKSVLAYCKELQTALLNQNYANQPIRVKIDDRDMNGGEKTWHWIKKGVPIRLEIGPRDMANNSVFMGRRDLGVKDKQSLSKDEFITNATTILAEIQANLFKRAMQYRTEHTHEFDNLEAFKAFFATASEDREIHGGFAVCYAIDDPAIEEYLKPLKVTARCIPLAQDGKQGKCIFTGKSTMKKIVFAKAY